MGRAMLIIVAGLLLSVGITQTSVNTVMGNLVNHSADIADNTQARNIAYMGSELAIRDMIDDPSWRDGEEKTYSLGNGTSDVSLTEVDTNVMRVVSTGTYNGATSTINLLLGENAGSGVPKFYSALGIIMEDPGEFTFSAGGASGIDGNDVSGTCDPVPGVTVVHDSDKNYIESNQNGNGGGGRGKGRGKGKGKGKGKGNNGNGNNGNNGGGASNISGDPDVYVDSELSFDEVKKLVDALVPGATRLPAGNYHGSLGTKSNPGVFVVESKTKITGNNVGYGILIIKNPANGGQEALLELRGTMQFNGLVIFDNGFAIDAKGTPEIRGSVIVGKSNPDAPDFNVDLGGTADFRYDCSAQKYADNAAAGYVSNKRSFKRITVYVN